ncbi:unnamed protein product [Peronospora destructor]|uniref:Alpha-L-arabinofuranosidase B catalytic domain-containing protein n=1 Tax=Peronospora destructor TaxID=86335 RepID=A0AAV0UYS1_9STRA|nr:unnamed protein product [Peronospora destructor]
MLTGLPLFTAVLIGVARAGPCDIYDKAGTPCVAAHSTVRALRDDYIHGLYQVKPPAGGAKKKAEGLAVANRLPVKIGEHKAYGVWIEDGIGYRNNNTTGIATGDDAQAIYMVVDGTRYNTGCCFDYGNAETTNNDDGPGTMEALYFGSSTQWGRGEGTGPWVMADLEDGLFGCVQKQCPNLPTVKYRYLVAMLKGRSGGTFALKQGDAQSGTLTTTYDGPRPPKYTVMKKQGAIILGIGGDNSNWAIGNFFEGCIVNGDPTDAIDNKIQTNIVSAGYGQQV